MTQTWTDSYPYLISGSSIGNITIWDLKNKQISHQIKNAHVNGSIISSLQFLNKEPIMISTANDNSLKVKNNKIKK